MRRCVTPLRPLLVGLVIGWLAVPSVARAVESTFVTIVGPSGNSADVSAGRRLLVDTGESQPFQKTRGATVDGTGQPFVR